MLFQNVLVIAVLLYPSIGTEVPNFIPFGDEENQKCAIGRLNILANGILKDDVEKN